MEKTKLGISTTLLAAVVCLLGYYAGYVITAIAVGYILLKEENEWLKKMSVKVIALMLVFSILPTLIHLIPNIISLVESLCYLFTEEYFEFNYSGIFNFLSSVVDLLKKVVFLLLGFFALIGKNFKIPVLDDLLDKMMNKE